MSLEERPPFSPGPAPASAVHRREPSQPILCGAIIAACAALYLYEATRPGGTINQPVHFGMLHGPDVQNGQFWRLITHVFEHADLIHILLNMSVVFTLGTAFERIAGHGIFAVVSFVAALGSATLSLLFSYDAYMLGASGMILGWAGAILPISTEQGRRAIGTWLVQIAIISVVIPRVSWQGHLGGFLFGLVCGFALKLGRKPFWSLAPFLAIAAVGAALAATHSSLHPGS